MNHNIYQIIKKFESANATMEETLKSVTAAMWEIEHILTDYNFYVCPDCEQWKSEVEMDKNKENHGHCICDECMEAER